MKSFFIFNVILYCCLHISKGQYSDPKDPLLVWCTTSIEEQYKCGNFSMTVKNDRHLFGRDSYFQVICKQASNKDECMDLLDQEKADVTSLDGGDVFIGGRYHSLVPILQEVHPGDKHYYYSVAVIKKGTLSDISSLYQLRSKKACFPGVGSLSGWVIPIKTLMQEAGLEIIDCNNHVKSAIKFFGPSCAVNSLTDEYNPIGDNSDKLCQLCTGPVPGKCTSADPYAGFNGAFRCLVEAGDIAFLKHTTVSEMVKNHLHFISLSENDFELLCKDGSRRPVNEYSNCNWGQVPSDAIVVSSAKPYSVRKAYQKFLQDSAINLYALEDEHQTYTSYLGKSMDSILYVRQCTVISMTLCITSDPELEKCIKMMIAMKSQLLKPELHCYKGRSHGHCMQAIKNGNADVAVFDAGDIYTAGLQYDLIPFMAEVYNLGKPEYYVVAVAKEEDPSTELTYLRGKYTCHTGIFTAAGWIIPLAYLISNGWIRSYGCDSMHAAAEYFEKSCVPGALSPEYATKNAYDNLCQLCHGSSFHYCRRDATEDYYGYTGAFRCLIEGGGQVAFLKHTTVYENTDGKRREWWARDALHEDFQLLCPDGTRSSMSNYEICNIGKVRANAIVTRGGDLYNETEINAYINLFTYAQQYFSRKVDDEFSMFMSTPPYSDLIFQDASQQLRVIKRDDRYYDRYLGSNFMRARRIVDCQALASSLQLSVTLISFCLVILILR